MSRQRHASFCSQCGGLLELRLHEHRDRPVCPACGHVVFFAPNLAVVTVLARDAGILLVRRANEPRRGLWALPAGFVEWDEDPRGSARREVWEETGLRVRIDRLIEVFHTPDDEGVADIVIGYAGTVIGGLLEARDDAEEAGWFGRDEVPELAFLPTRLLVDLWRSGRL